MGWTAIAVQKLSEGETVTVRPSGHSMTGRINHKDYVTLAPCKPHELNVGDIVLVRVKGNILLHLIKAVDGKGRFLIGNNRGKINGWASQNSIYGVVIKVESPEELRRAKKAGRIK